MKKICCIVLTVLCLLPCLAGCGKNDKYEEQRVILDADLSQPGAICMQYRDLSFEIEQLQITDKESGVVTNSYSATLVLPEAREISALPVVIEFNGDSLKIDGYFFSDESPAMVYLDYANGVTHDITVTFDGYEKTVVSSVSCLD